MIERTIHETFKACDGTTLNASYRTIEHDGHRLKEVAPGRFHLVGHRSAPYIDQHGNSWSVWPLKDSQWHDNLGDAIQDAINREQRNKRRSVYTRNA